MTISFEEALALQSKLQSDTYGQPLEDIINPEEMAAQVRLHVLALEDEIHEVLRETPWKPWKKTGVYSPQKYKEEMVDAFHFFMNLMLLGNMSVDDLLEGYQAKHDENIARQRRGY